MWQGSWVHSQYQIIAIAKVSRKIVIRRDYLQYWENSSNTGLFEFRLANTDLRQLS